MPIRWAAEPPCHPAGGVTANHFSLAPPTVPHLYCESMGTPPAQVALFPPPPCRSHIKEVMLTPTHLAMVLDYEAGGSVAEFVAQQVGQCIQQAGWHLCRRRGKMVQPCTFGSRGAG